MHGEGRGPGSRGWPGLLRRPPPELLVGPWTVFWGRKGDSQQGRGCKAATDASRPVTEPTPVPRSAPGRGHRLPRTSLLRAGSPPPMSPLSQGPPRSSNSKCPQALDAASRKLGPPCKPLVSPLCSGCVLQGPSLEPQCPASQARDHPGPRRVPTEPLAPQVIPAVLAAPTGLLSGPFCPWGTVLPRSDPRGGLLPGRVLVMPGSPQCPSASCPPWALPEQHRPQEGVDT